MVPFVTFSDVTKGNNKPDHEHLGHNFQADEIYRTKEGNGTNILGALFGL